MKKIDEVYSVQKEIMVQGRPIRIYVKRTENSSSTSNLDAKSQAFGGEKDDSSVKRF